ncbi:MAG: TolB family protein [Candidatus Polarisedimenticolia bacterium]
MAVYDTASGELVSSLNIAITGIQADLEVIAASPNERQIAFSGVKQVDSDSYRIWTVDLQNALAPKPATKGPMDSSPAWASDSKLLFARLDSSKKLSRCSTEITAQHLWTASLVNGTERQLTKGLVRDDYPSWAEKKGIVLFARVPLDELTSNQCGESNAGERPLAGILEGFSTLAQLLASSSQVAYVRL